MRRWDDDVVFKNQARGTEDKRKKEFVNVRLLQPSMQMIDWLIISTGSLTFRLPQAIHGQLFVSYFPSHMSRCTNTANV